MPRRALGGVGVLVALGLAIPAAQADVVSGRADESIQQAYPISAGHTYPGAFDDTNYEDVDYLAFNVTSANQTLKFTVANTTQTCNDPNDAGCPVYATLMDSNDQQVGGDSSDAGTIATNGDTEVLAWTFAAPGTYYLLMESDSDLPPGSPSYAVTFAGSSPGPGGGTTAPLLRSFRARSPQHGTRVGATAVLGRAATRVTETLLALRPGRRPGYVTRAVRVNVSAGSHQLALPLPASYRTRLKHKHRLSMLVRLVVQAGQRERATVSRRVLLLP